MICLITQKRDFMNNCYTFITMQSSSDAQIKPWSCNRAHHIGNSKLKMKTEIMMEFSQNMIQFVCSAKDT